MPARIEKNQILVLENGDISTMIKLLHENTGLNNVITFSDASRGGERVTQTLRQIAETPGWGISRYCSPSDTQREILTHYDQKHSILKNIELFAAKMNGFAGLPGTAVTIASELIMNAAFDAPVDAKTGEAKYANLSRQSNLVLTEQEYIEVNYGVSGDSLVLSARDHFGSLTRKKIVDNLYRCDQKGPDQVRQTTGGAGVGLYLLLNVSSQLDIYIEPQKSTEVVALINISKRQKEYELRGTGINIFIAESL